MPSVSPLARLFGAAALVSAWLISLLLGWTLGGAIHLALLGALAIFPWREARSSESRS